MRRASTRVVALIAVLTLSMTGVSAGASAATQGATKWCQIHPHWPTCRSGSGGGGGTGGTGGGPPTITVTVAPDPLIETGQSEVSAVVEVATNPAFSGDPVDINSQQLAGVCGGSLLFGSLQTGASYTSDSIQVFLDADGNATVSLYGIDCAPGNDLIEADLVKAPYYTALGTINVLPPAATPAGVTGSPANEVETGNTAPSGNSDVYAVFYVETDPVYAEQTVDIDSPQLFDRCGGTIAPVWISNQGSFSAFTASATLDDDGNAVIAFSGSSCAAGSSLVTADVAAGTHSTYTTTFTVVAPTPTI